MGSGSAASELEMTESARSVVRFSILAGRPHAWTYHLERLMLAKSGSSAGIAFLRELGNMIFLRSTKRDVQPCSTLPVR